MKKLLWLLLLVPGLVIAGDVFDEESSQLFIPELRSGEVCYKEVVVQFFPADENMNEGAFEVNRFEVVECPTDVERLEWKPDCNGFGPSPGCG